MNTELSMERIGESYEEMSTSSSASEGTSRSVCSPLNVRLDSLPTSQSAGPGDPMSPTVSSTTGSDGSGTYSRSSGTAPDYSSFNGGSDGGNIILNNRNHRDDEISDDQRAAMKSAHISNEHVRLSELLEYMHPEDIKTTLTRHVAKRDAKALIALSILFPRSRFPPVEHAHCVRCHRTYTPVAAGGTQCSVPHANAQVVKLEQNGQGATFLCKACKTQFRLVKMFFYDEKVSSYMSGMCFAGKHTTNSMAVKYNGSVMTCEENGCIELYV